MKIIDITISMGKGILANASAAFSEGIMSEITSAKWIKSCHGHNIKISMGARARCLDDIWDERFWRTIKREYVYLNPEENATVLIRWKTKIHQIL